MTTSAPVFTSTASKTFTETNAGTFSVTATGDTPIGFTETGALPSGVTLASNGTLSGTPAAGTAGSYPITITATDANSNTATQAFTLTVNPAPATAVIVPSNGAAVHGNATLDATASSTAGISSVQFVITGGSYNKSVIGTAGLTAYGWLFGWNTTTVPSGTYSVQSVATDTGGNTGYSAPITVTVDNTPPTTSVLVPSTGADLHGTSATLDATAAASYGVGISKVQFVITGGSYNKSVIGTSVLTPYGYIYQWNTTTVPGGTYSLQSLATDGAGNTAYSSPISVTVDNTPPTTSVLIPSTGAILHGTSATLDATAAASYGVGITKVQFVITGGSYNQSVVGTSVLTPYGYIYQWNTTTVPSGTYTLQSLATDGAGNTAYSPGISVTVDNTPPTTAVVSPTDGKKLMKSSTNTLTATASAPYGVAISSVKFVLTGGSYSQTVIGTATSTVNGWVYQWNDTGVPNGTYTLQSLATDAEGNTAYSPGISIKIVNVAN